MSWKKIQGLWKKLLFHDWISVYDEWGVHDKYKIDIYIYRTFSLKHGFMYQVNIPDFTVNDKNIFIAVTEAMRYLYRGGCPCYYRLKEQLMKKGLWQKI